MFSREFEEYLFRQFPLHVSLWEDCSQGVGSLVHQGQGWREYNHFHSSQERCGDFQL